MKVYLAGAFSRQAEIRGVAHELAKLHIVVTSRWLYEQGPGDQNLERYRRETAFKDIQDLREADILVRFTDKFESDEMVPSYLLSCARMFEFGMAWERGIPVVTVGGQQNVFDSLPNIIHLPDVESLKKFLSGR